MKDLENLRIPKYVQLMLSIREQIENNVLKHGDPLPTREKLMKEYDLSLSTVTRSITELERQGWLISRQGSGTYVVKRSTKEVEDRLESIAVGLMLPSSSPLSYDLAYEISLEAKSHNVKILTVFTPEDEETELNYARYLFDLEIDALIWSPVYPKRHIGVASVFTKNNIPVIICEKVTDDPGSLSICVRRDYYGGTTKSLQHLLEIGHRRIAYVGPRGNECDFGPVYERWSAYKDFMKAHNQWAPEELVLNPSIFQEWHLHADEIRALMSSPKAPTAIIGFDDTIALDTAQCLISLGYKIPDEISIFGNGDSIVSQYSVPRLTTISPCQSEYVDTLFRALMKLINVKESDSSERDIAIPQRLIHRESVKPVGDILKTN